MPNVKEIFDYQHNNFERVNVDNIDDLREVHDLDKSEIKPGDVLYRYLVRNKANTLLHVSTNLDKINDHLINNRLILDKSALTKQIPTFKHS